MQILTLFHVVLSLIGIAAGFPVVAGFLTARPRRFWTFLFLVSTVATSVTGFFFPSHQFTPAHGFGVVSLLVLAVALYALVGRRLAGGWRAAYVLSAVFAFYLNFFVLIAQSFQKLPALKALAPTQSEPPFAVAQLAALLVFIGLGVFSVRRFHPAPAAVVG